MVKNLSGMWFGNLIVLGKEKKKENVGLLKWKCICTCGNYIAVDTKSLTDLVVLDCGCSLNT